ncbi:hypothetical protein CsatB_030493 [Cannabis sativa]
MRPVILFQGYSSTTGSGYSTAVTGESITDGVQSEVTYTICKGHTSLMNTIDIKQSANININLLGSADEKMNFLRNLNITEKSLAIVVVARKVEGKRVQTNARLASDIAVPISDVSEFFFHYGDAYVSSITTGGEYIGVYSFHTETENESVKLELELKANGVFKFGTLGADFQVRLESAVENSQSKVSFKQMILGVKDSELPKREDMVEFARKFPSQTLNAPKVLAFETTGYEHVVGVGHGFDPIAINRNKLVGTGSKDLGLAGELGKVTQLINQIHEIQSIYDFYGGYSDLKLREVAVQAKQDLASLQRIFSAFDSNPIQDLSIPHLPSLSNGTPRIQYTISFSPEFGRRGAQEPKTPFDLFIGYDEYIKNKTKITGIQMRSDTRVNNIIVDFESTVGRHRESYGKAEGGWSKKLLLGSDDFIKKIEIRSDRDVDQLGFYVDLKNNRWVVGGGNGGKDHTFVVPNGSFILGFRGFYSNIIDQIDFVYATFHPAKWSAS